SKSKGQAERGPLLLDVGGGQFDRRAPGGPIVAAFCNSCSDSIATLSSRRVWKSNDDDNRVAPSRVHFDLHFVGIHAINGRGINFRQHCDCRVSKNEAAATRQLP